MTQLEALALLNAPLGTLSEKQDITDFKFRKCMFLVIKYKNMNMFILIVLV